MKDMDMRDLDEATYDELAEYVESNLRKAMKAARIAERRTCAEAEKGDTTAAAANAEITASLGHMMLAKAEATKAGNRIANPAVFFGGK